MKPLLKEPLLHFLLLGALLFAGYSLIHRGDQPTAGKIVVTQGKIENLQASFGRVWQRPPSSSELDGLIQEYIREEVLAREAIALGLDRDDTVIRRRLRQKMEFVAHDLSAPQAPSETDLKEFLARHPERFCLESTLTVRQVFLNPEKRGESLERDAVRLLDELNQGSPKADFQTLGDATLLNPEWANQAESELTRQFGEVFVRQLAPLPEQRWHGPVISGYGAHLVYVENRKPGRTPELSEIQERVAREWADARHREASEQFYQNLLKRYSVSIERPSSATRTHTLTAQVGR